jgi:acetoin utilization protein AcuB
VLLVKDSMTREIVTLSPDETAGTALALCRERRIRHLPVLKEGRLVGIVSDRDLRSSTPAIGDAGRAASLQELVGILTASDVMDALVHLVGANEPGSRMEVAVPDRPGALAGAAGVFGMCGINIVSAAMGSRREPAGGGSPGERVVVFRVDTIDTAEAVQYLEEAGYSVLWPPKA